MSTVPPSQSGATPSLFADPIWNTSLLPASINGGANPKLAVSASVNGILYNFTDPENEAQFVSNVNVLMSLTFYGAASGYQCTGPTASVKPCRYVVMHATNQVPSQAAHQLLVDAAGNATYIDTTWTSVPQ
jgi:hypothetical protein